jgi:hypothetical protein
MPDIIPSRLNDTASFSRDVMMMFFIALLNVGFAGQKAVAGRQCCSRDGLFRPN